MNLIKNIYREFKRQITEGMKDFKTRLVSHNDAVTVTEKIHWHEHVQRKLKYFPKDLLITKRGQVPAVILEHILITLFTENESTLYHMTFWLVLSKGFQLKFLMHFNAHMLIIRL